MNGLQLNYDSRIRRSCGWQKATFGEGAEVVEEDTAAATAEISLNTKTTGGRLTRAALFSYSGFQNRSMYGK